MAVDLITRMNVYHVILQRGVELRLLPDLWSLRDAVIESTLEFSIIRWRNVSPRLDGRPHVPQVSGNVSWTKCLSARRSHESVTSCS